MRVHQKAMLYDLDDKVKHYIYVQQKEAQMSFHCAKWNSEENTSSQPTCHFACDNFTFKIYKPIFDTTYQESVRVSHK